MSLALVGALFLQTLAPLAYAQQQGGGGGGQVQPVDPVVAVPTDPGDAIVPDNYVDLPVAFPSLSTTSSDPENNYMWTAGMTAFYNNIDFSQDPQDPLSWSGGATTGGSNNDHIKGIREIMPWEQGGGGSIGGGGGLITPTPPKGGGSGGGGIDPNPGGGGGASGSRGEVYGRMNTNTGMMDFQIPIVSFSGPGQGAVDLALQLKSLTPTWQTKLWTDNYDIRLDRSSSAGKAVITLPSGLSLPFSVPTPSGEPNMTAMLGPMGIRAKLYNSTFGWSELRWQNGDIWRFSADSQFNPMSNGHLSYIQYKKGGGVTVNRTQYSTTISTGSRSVSINTNPSTLPTGLSGRITGPNGITDISSVPAQYGQYPMTITYPGGVKKIKLYYSNFNQSTILPGGGAYSGPGGTKFVAYQDAKQVAANSTLAYNYTFDTLGRVIKITDPNNKSITYSYIADGQTKITNQDGKVSYDYYSNGQYIGGMDEANFTTVISRNAEHDVTSYRNERGQVWNMSRDADGNALTVTNPLLKTTIYTYNQYGSVLTKTNPYGKTVTFTYDANNRIKTAHNALQELVFSVNYDAWGQPTSVTDRGNRTSYMTYDLYTGDLMSTMSPEGLTSTALYNGLGQPTVATAPGNKTTTIQYDALSRPWKITTPAGPTEFTYDLNDNVTSVKDALNRTSLMTYDVMDNLITSKNPRLDTETYTYTVLGELKTVTNGRGKTRSYQYTARGELKFMYLPDGTTEFYGYQGDGSLASFEGSGRSKINYQYDNVGRLSVIDYPAMTDTTFTYDDAGRRISMTDTSGQTSWFYDDANRLTSLNQAGKVTSYTYNPDGSRATMTQPAGTTTYSYDSYGRFTGLTNPFNEITGVSYDSLSRVAQKTQRTPASPVPGTIESYSYDTLDRLSLKTTINMGTVTISTESYSYNAVSEVLDHTEDGIMTSYGYDAASQLTSETRPGYSASYTFDGNGNRLSKTVNGQVENYSYDDGDKLLSAGSKTYQYDAAGRTTQVRVGISAPSILTYDDEDRLKTTYGPMGSQSYSYNGFDTRVGKTVGGATTSYHRDGAGVTAPLISDSGATYTPGISERRNGVSTFLNSGMKDVAKQTDGVGNITATRKYDAYGMVIGSTGTWKGPFGYSGSAGYQEDETGLQLLGHRYYDSSTGRFITRDPIKDGRNWYGYCDNNPVNAIDADGLKKVVIVVGPDSGEVAPREEHMDFALTLRDYYVSLGYEVVLLVCPTPGKLKKALEGADGLVFIGHGNPSGGVMRSDPGGKGDTRTWLTAALMKDILQGRKLKFIALYSCNMAWGDKAASAWMALADEVFACDNVLYDREHPSYTQLVEGAKTGARPGSGPRRLRGGGSRTRPFGDVFHPAYSGG